MGRPAHGVELDQRDSGKSSHIWSRTRDQMNPARMSVSVKVLGSAPRSGRVVAVHGSVIDIAFDAGMLPAINDAVAIDWDRGPPLVAEVQQHPGPAAVRAVALGSTAGLRRGTSI